MGMLFLRQRLEPGREERLDARWRTGELQQPWGGKCFAPLNRVGHGKRQPPAVGGGNRGPKCQSLRLPLALTEVERVFVGSRKEWVFGGWSGKRTFGHADDEDAVEGQARDRLHRAHQDPAPEA